MHITKDIKTAYLIDLVKKSYLSSATILNNEVNTARNRKEQQKYSFFYFTVTILSILHPPPQ